MPGVHKCKHNISYLFLLWVFHPSSASFASPLSSTLASSPHSPPLTLLMCTFPLLFLSLCLGFSLSPPLDFLTRILFARCHKSGKSWVWAGRRATPPNKTRDGSNIYSNSGVRREIKSSAASCRLHSKRGTSRVLSPWACSPADWFKL